jgi:glycosyltransferase involved in cell wall biosynthesis
LALAKLARYLRRRKPAVTLSSMDYANVICAFAYRLAGSPGRLVLAEATIAAAKGVGDRGAVSNAILRWLMRRAYPLAHAVVANSGDTRRALLALGLAPESRVHVIGNPVELPEPGEGVSTDCQAHVEGAGAPFICAIGRLVPAKGFDVLLDALALCRHSEAHLVLLGEGRLRQELARQAKALGVESRVHFAGFVGQPAGILSQAEMLVLPSRWEGFGNVLVEALALGKPVVATECPGGPAHILGNGQFGRLVPVDDAAALAEAIDATFEDPVSTPAERMARAQSFGASRIAREYLDGVLLPDER